MATVTAELTAEAILEMIEQLPRFERLRLHHILAEQATAQVKPPRDKRVPCEPQPDRTREWAWSEAHKQEYAGQWVALEGDRLVAASAIQQEVFDALKTAMANRPLIHRIPSPDDLPYVGI